MAKRIQNSTFHILTFFLFLCPNGWFLPSLFPIGWHLHFSLRRIAKNTPTSHITIHIMKGVRQSIMRIHDVAGKSAVYCPHHEGI
jgi:hypothetical protein